MERAMLELTLADRKGASLIGGEIQDKRCRNDKAGCWLGITRRKDTRKRQKVVSLLLAKIVGKEQKNYGGV